MRVIARPASRRGVYLCARGNECERDLLRSVVYTLVQIYGRLYRSLVPVCVTCACMKERLAELSSNRDKTLDVRNVRR